MKEHRIYKAIHSILFLLLAFVADSQTTMVRASVDKTNILIGEQINFLIEVNIPENEPIGFFSPDSIPHFEFLQRGKIDTTNTNKGTILKQLFRITSFDSGQWVIPSYSLPQSENLKTDSIIINVGFMPMDTTKDYNDIKEIIDVNAVKEQDWTWYYVGGGLGLLLLLIYLLTRRKKKKELQATAITEKIVDPYTEAMEELDKLQKDATGVKSDAKLYYTRLTDIFRRYVERKKGIHSLQQTTDDLVTQLRGIGLDKEPYNQLAQALRLSDFVKFAKYIPTDPDNRNTFDTLKNSIQSIEKMATDPVEAGTKR